MGDAFQILRDALPEALGGLAVVIVIGILGFLYRKLSRKGRKRKQIPTLNLHAGSNSTIVQAGHDIHITSPLESLEITNQIEQTIDDQPQSHILDIPPKKLNKQDGHQFLTKLYLRLQESIKKFILKFLVH